MISFSFSSLSKRPGATIAGVFSLALGSVLLLCGAGSAPIENLLPQGTMQGDLNAGGHNLTNAATVSATNVIVSGSLTAPSLGTLAALNAVNNSNWSGTVLSVGNGGTGTASPGLVAGSNVTIAGSWPNQTVNASGGGGGGSAITVTRTAFVDASGNDGTAIMGDPGHPYLTAQAAYAALIATYPSTPSLLKLGVGTGWSIALGSLGAWNSNVEVSGAGYPNTALGITTDGGAIALTSDQSVLLSVTTDSTASSTNGGAVTLTNCSVGSISANAASPVDDFSTLINGYHGGNISLTDCLLFGGTTASGSAGVEGGGPGGGGGVHLLSCYASAAASLHVGTVSGGNGGAVYMRCSNFLGVIYMEESPGISDGAFTADLSYVATVSGSGYGGEMYNCVYGALGGSLVTLNNCNAAVW
jgi:hypothetical protein